MVWAWAAVKVTARAAARLRPPAKDLDQDVLRRVVVQRNPVAIDRAKERTSSANFQDSGGLAKAKFADALAKLRVAGQLPHATRLASRQLAERKKVSGSVYHG
jgi:hypothetical protein